MLLLFQMRLATGIRPILKNSSEQRSVAVRSCRNRPDCAKAFIPLPQAKQSRGIRLHRPISADFMSSGGRLLTLEIARAFVCDSHLRKPGTGATLPPLPNAQKQFHPDARAKDVDLRDGRGLGALAKDFAALPLHSFSGAQS
jgi:hypothetical protein